MKFIVRFHLFFDLLVTGLLREAEQQMKSSLRAQPIVNTYLELCNVYLRLDQPHTALDLLTEGTYVPKSLTYPYK